ncbi:hypothetical protein DFP72DRAFT_1162323 [Ephemerocybe angulata]|uniref:MYND-type domain-containing protein n=1 Tax=Ephemerocybe angulata TaxID=980116 RepID=A0A8H6IJB1_9AGAR|nr:hypothetical protein DFP72DRAFT_1162323 [Tulosesus angulatus]
MAQHSTWKVRNNLHYLGTQSVSTSLVSTQQSISFEEYSNDIPFRNSGPEEGIAPSYWRHVFPERNLDPWRNIFDTLSGSNIPKCNILPDSSAISVTAINNARAALHQAETVISALGEGKDLPEAKDFVDSHFYMLLECWNDVLKWLLYLMLNTPNASDPLTIFASIRAFAAMICFDGWSHLQEEILDKPHTIDFIYLLLHQQDPYMTMRSELRAKVVKSLYERPGRMCSGITRGYNLWSPVAAGYDMPTLSLVVSKLGQDPEISMKIRCTGMASEAWYTMAGGMAYLTGYDPRATLDHITPHSHHRILALVRANAVSTAFKCLVRLMAEEEPGKRRVSILAELVLRCILAHMTASEVYRAVLEDLTGKEDVLDRYIKEVGSKSSIVQQYQRVIDLSRLVVEKHPKLKLSLCWNREHPESSTGEESDAKLWQCSDCLSVAYCSEECRTEDWSRFHSHERKLLARTQDFNAQAPSYSYVSQTVRQDQLRFLECTINSSPPDLSEHPQQPTHIMIDFRGELGDVQFMDSSEPLKFCLHPQGEVHCPGAFQNRVAQFSNYICAEAIFAYDWQWSTHVFAKLRYSPEASEGTRYRVMDSVFVFQPDQDRLTRQSWGDVA